MPLLGSSIITSLLFPVMYSLLLFSLAMFVALVRPYKRSSDNVIESLLNFLLALVLVIISLHHNFSSILIVYVAFLLVTIPHGCFVVFIVYSVCKKYKRYCDCGCKEKKEVMEDNELPDRFVNAENYTQSNALKPTIGRAIL